MNTIYICPSGISTLEYIKRQKQGISGGIENQLTDFLKNSENSLLKKASAEINTLYHLGISIGDKIVFLTSDTDEGELTAKSLAKFLKSKNYDCTVRRIKGLQIKDKKRFDCEGIPNITDEIIKEYENAHYSFNIVLIATTGFKATIPYITLIGMVFHLPIKYIFEYSDSIIDLPPIPIEFDLERLKLLEPVIDRIMSDYLKFDDLKKEIGASHDELTNLLNDILIEEDGLVTLRPTGRILYQRYLQIKGNRVFISSIVQEKLKSEQYNEEVFENLFTKFKDPIHLQSKLHNEVKRKGKVDLDCYKPGSTNERIFFYAKGKNVYICDIFLHAEYERAIEQGGLLHDKYENKCQFTEVSF